MFYIREFIATLKSLNSRESICGLFASSMTLDASSDEISIILAIDKTVQRINYNILRCCVTTQL